MIKTLLLAIAVVSLMGCDVGNAPTGGSEADTKKVFDSQTLEQKVKFFMNSPMPQADKQKKIEEVYAEAGQKMPDDLFTKAGGAPTAR